MTSGQGPTAKDLDEIALCAPLDGWAGPLAEVPDPVFAEKMMGDGIALDPTSGTLTAPCDGDVMLLHPARHAMTLRCHGAEILMHIGLDTVALAGEGFAAHVRQGQSVNQGDALISFDLDRLGGLAKSLIVPIVIANGEAFAVTWRRENCAVKKGEPLMRLKPLGPSASVAASPAQMRKTVTIALVHGLHARPAARLAVLARSFPCEIFVGVGEKRANAKSAIALMGLGLGQGAEAELLAEGRDGEAAIAALAQLIERMEEVRDAGRPAGTKRAPPGEWTGIGAAPGLAMGCAVTLRLEEIALEEEGRGQAHEMRRLQDALAAAKARLQRREAKDDAHAILGAHQAFLDDPDLIAGALEAISRGKSAGFAWRDSIRRQAAVLLALDRRFSERAADLADLERQVLTEMGEARSQAVALPDGAILLAEELLPSQFAALDRTRLKGVALANGGPTSHVAILAQAAGIPMLVACGEGLLAIEEGARLFLDAAEGRLTRAGALSGAWIAAHAKARDEARPLAQAPAHTKDGVRIEVNANLGSLGDAAPAIASGAEGCGLLRTEFLFLNREAPPDEAEQVKVYRAIAEALGGKPLVIRTLDIGGDKPAPYFPFPREQNPALGLRGVRVSLLRPELLAVQLRAILRAVPARQVRIMAPMIASLSELREVRRILDAAAAKLGAHPVPLGAMVETPASAVTADLLAAEADFLSIGTNDLAQYCLAMDRGNASVAEGFDALHPAVLRLIASTAEGALKHGKPVSVCGGLASEPLAAPLLVGLGVRALSSAPARIPALKARLASITFDRCERLARQALMLSSAREVRGLMSGEK